VNDVTQLFQALERKEPGAAHQLFLLLYDELRDLAARKLAREGGGQTLEPTALVHEVYLRLAGAAEGQHWEGRGHFFAAAAEAMRRILIESARRKHREKHGGGRQQVPLAEDALVVQPTPDKLLAVDEALTRLAAEDAEAADVVKLHFFAGLTFEQVANALGISRASVFRQWAYARAWLHCALGEGEEAAGT
jgi:RNA polymerase sigma factor (TIGR02999 family)